MGKGEYHATALNPEGVRLHDKPLPQDEHASAVAVRAVGNAQAGLVVVNQSASIGALPVAVARSVEVEVAYLPGLAMRRIADLHPGNADARDAYVIAEAVRTLATRPASSRHRR